MGGSHGVMRSRGWMLVRWVGARVRIRVKDQMIHVLVRGPLTRLGSDYSACLSPRNIDVRLQCC
eukprot:1391813-Amorphochlora_amoeboformis.AAC.1